MSRPKSLDYLGAHMSISGGLHLACERGEAVGADVIQIFTRNQQQWRAKPITDDEAAAFRQARAAHHIRVAFAHDSYLVNLCSESALIRKKSIAAFIEEIRRCDLLGLSFVVTHPGSPGEAGSDEGVKRMIASLNEVLRASRGATARVLLETSAGQGACVGCRFEQLRAMLEGVADGGRLGVCFDTCHVFAAGYDLRTREAYDATMAEFDRVVGLDRIEAFHVNDSKKGLGSRVDRHEHIGKGAIGLDAFRCLMNDRRFARVPKVLETPKEGDMDIANLRVLGGLVA